ncbi:hypothetical protein PHYSODRAFT_285769 [Phytophthora sojae]|uniref:RxLR effector protein n=2 Tax=Phytophthora sojae TaxID=67593 RepID=G4ZB99_PHYSP|nr:hypothetical protein PHYSODRAFT_285769 [Phytophthora sojae]AEK81389.1 Avh463 [Phytophthora sojae]AEK81390.1 Avh463 [Phytophthora sojae]AEK81391.1 Avh463 [Phytophthora sojae]EGZ22695.1 hypothetical protein PHYSODRAFT_285769 [Phytophthora sojae]|eukprot:XP_009525412.1 hypothetical protein PHYSODRAFT_285769 [Phytophthora sojae]
MRLHILALLLMLIICISSVDAISTTTNKDTQIQPRRFLRSAPKAPDNDRSASSPKPLKVNSGSKLKNKLERVSVPAITMENEMWNKILTPMFKEFYRKEIHPKRVSKFLATVKPREARDNIGELYKSWYNIRAANRR